MRNRNNSLNDLIDSIICGIDIDDERPLIALLLIHIMSQQVLLNFPIVW